MGNGAHSDFPQPAFLFAYFSLYYGRPNFLYQKKVGDFEWTYWVLRTALLPPTHPKPEPLDKPLPGSCLFPHPGACPGTRRGKYQIGVWKWSGFPFLPQTLLKKSRAPKNFPSRPKNKYFLFSLGFDEVLRGPQFFFLLATIIIFSEPFQAYYSSGS